MKPLLKESVSSLSAGSCNFNEMKVLSRMNMEKALDTVVELFSLDVIDQRYEDRVTAVLHEMFPPGIEFFKGERIDDTIPPFVWFLPPFLDLIAILFHFVLCTTSGSSRTISGGVSVAFLGKLIGKLWDSNFRDVHINVPDTGNVLSVWKDRPNCIDICFSNAARHHL
jgi:hypothetical protein